MAESLANYAIVIEVLVGLGQAVVAWFIWSMRQSFVPKKDYSELEKKVDKLDTALLLQGQALQNVPTDGDLHDIIKKMGEVHTQSSVTAETVKGISNQLEGIGRQVGQLNNYLLDRGGR